MSCSETEKQQKEENSIITRNASRSDIITAQKMKFSIKDFFSECDQIRRSLRIWSHLMKKFLMESFIFCAEFAENCSRISQILRKVVFDRITDQKIVKRLISCTGRFWNKVLTLVVLNILSQ